MNNRLIKSNDAGGGGGCTNTVDLYNPFPDGGGVALYQLNGDATDVSGNYDGTASNVTYGTGQFGQAGVFNGSSSKITTSLTQTNTSAWAWSFWVNINTKPTAGNIAAILSNINGAAPFAGVTFLIDSPNFGIASNGSNIWTTNTINPSLSTWYHIAITYNGSGTITPYINGQSYGAISHTPSNGNTITIGDSDVSSWGSFNGSIDQVRIFSRALRPYEVEALYTEEYCTPTIVPSEHFNTVAWAADGTSGDISITGVGFQPDFVWAKARTQPYSNALFDSVRGVGSTHMLFSDSTNSESTNTANSSGNGFVSSFDVDGFTGGAGTSGNAYYNETSQDYVAWNFKAAGYANTFNVLENGSTTSSATAAGAGITAGTNTTNYSVSANRDAGFSVVKFDAGSTAWNVGHGLGAAPSVIIEKMYTFGNQWAVYHKDLGTGKFLQLSTTSAAGTDAGAFSSVTDTTWTSYTTLTSGSYIAYCFAEVEGFSNFGSYVGNGSTSGPTVVTGFEPAFVMVKLTDGTGGNWQMMDNKRGEDKQLYANLSNAEGANNYDGLDFLENGFQLKTDYVEFNGNGNKYIYMAFAADPTTIEPSLEDSFNTVTYTGNGGTNSITGVGFEPSMVWLKDRDTTYPHYIYDSVRGALKGIRPNVTDVESTNIGVTSFNTDGFTLDSNAGANQLNSPNVAWNWKGAEIPAINSNGSIPSVVSANPAAGFSIVSYTGNGANGDTVGHGLSDVPNVVIWKNRSDARNWVVWHSGLTSIDYSLILNSTSAEVLDSRTNRPFGQPTDSVLVLGEDNETNFSANNFIAYCFAEVAGFSKFGSYSGTGTSLNQINVGFAPRFVMIKRTNSTGGWRMYDNVRGLDRSIQAQSSDAEYDDTTNYLDFYANGFEFNNGVSYQSNPDINASGGTYIYMAFANQF